jgi:hypothetical protein
MGITVMQHDGTPHKHAGMLSLDYGIKVSRSFTILLCSDGNDWLPQENTKEL